MIDKITARAAYEGTGGWNDGRFGQAYDLIAEALKDRGVETRRHKLLEAVELAKLMAEPATMVSGWREIGKMCGYFTVQHKVDVSVSGSVVHQRLNQLSDAELLKIIQGGGLGEPDPQLLNHNAQPDGGEDGGEDE